MERVALFAKVPPTQAQIQVGALALAAAARHSCSPTSVLTVWRGEGRVVRLQRLLRWRG